MWGAMWEYLGDFTASKPADFTTKYNIIIMIPVQASYKACSYFSYNAVKTHYSCSYIALDSMHYVASYTASSYDPCIHVHKGNSNQCAIYFRCRLYLATAYSIIASQRLYAVLIMTIIRY